MSWHEPDRDRDPWRGPDGGPPDVDELLRRARRRIAGWFRRSPQPSGPRRLRLWWIVPPILVGIWLLTGFYQVPANHEAVVLQFGAYAGSAGEGLHWHWPWPVAGNRLVDMSENLSLSRHADVLTRDGKLVTLGVTVAYKVSDPARYLFGSAHPTQLVSALADEAIASAARENDLATLQGGGRAAAEQSLEKQISSELAAAGAGIAVRSVKIGRIALPATLTASRQKLDDARKKNEAAAAKARAAAAQSMKKTREQAHELIAAAQKRAPEREALARARVARFEALLPAWRKSPALTRETLREEAISGILAAVPKVVVSGPIKVLRLPVMPPATAAAPASTPAAVKAPPKGTRG